MEADLNFKCHLHNGDPLKARTIHVLPTSRDRPAAGNPPFTWEESARDAIKLEGFDHWTDWSVPGICYQLEKYNGIGYRAHHINSPYYGVVQTNIPGANMCRTAYSPARPFRSK